MQRAVCSAPLPRPYLAFDSVLCEALQHNLSGLVPPPHHPSTLYPLPTVVFRMFDYTDCPEVRHLHTCTLDRDNMAQDAQINWNQLDSFILG